MKIWMVEWASFDEHGILGVYSTAAKAEEARQRYIRVAACRRRKTARRWLHDHCIENADGTFTWIDLYCEERYIPADWVKQEVEATRQKERGNTKVVPYKVDKK